MDRSCVGAWTLNGAPSIQVSEVTGSADDHELALKCDEQLRSPLECQAHLIRRNYLSMRSLIDVIRWAPALLEVQGRCVRPRRPAFKAFVLHSSL